MKIKNILQQKTIYIIILIGIVALAAINFISWFFLQGVKTELTTALKQHILTVGRVSTKLLNGGDLEKIYPGMENSPLVIYYQQLLYDIKINNDLENIIITDQLGHLLVDYRMGFTIGDSLATFPLQPAMLRQSSLGEIPEPLLLKVADQYFLSAYLPVLDDFEEPVAVLIIDAPFRFFDSLSRFETGSIYLGAGGLVILLVFSFIILIGTRRLFRIQERMQEQERLAQLGQMAAAVAHEIRNPLSIMKGTADVLRKKYGDVSDEMLSYIPEEIGRLNRLVDDFLQFARQRKLELEKTAPEEILQQFKNQLNDERVQLKVDPGLPEVAVDRNALRQILLNLLNNSLDALQPDGQVEIRAYQETVRPHSVIIEINDTGKGISPEVLPRVFEPFYSTKASGSGLGLAICRQLIEQMQGSISIASRPDNGTTVRLKLHPA